MSSATTMSSLAIADRLEAIHELLGAIALVNGNLELDLHIDPHRIAPLNDLAADLAQEADELSDELWRRLRAHERHELADKGAK